MPNMPLSTMNGLVLVDKGFHVISNHINVVLLWNSIKWLSIAAVVTKIFFFIAKNNSETYGALLLILSET